MRFWVTVASKLILAGFLFGLAWWFYTGGSKAYVKEFDRTREALKSVKTWRYEQNRSDDPDYYQQGIVEADCAVGYHGKMHYHQYQGDVHVEVASVNNTLYGKNPETGEWKPTYGSPIVDGTQMCQQFAIGNAGSFFPENNELDDHYVVTKRDTKQINGSKCRQWLIQRVGVRGSDTTVCIGVKDHLPYEFLDADGSAVFTWNQPISFEWPVAPVTVSQ